MIHILKSSFWNLFGTAVIILSGAILTLGAPKILSIEDFGFWRLFILYSTYAGILHLGIADGYLLNNVTLAKSDAYKNLKRSLPFLLIQQLLITGIILLVFFVIFNEENYILIGASVLVFSITINLRTQMDNYLIIIKDFKTSNIVKILDKIIFLLLFLSLFFIKGVQYEVIIFLYVLASFIALLAIVWAVKPKFEWTRGIFKKNVADMKVGGQLLFSNVFIIILFNIDSIAVSMLVDIKGFAIFSFAITIIMLINQFAESISQVFFPYLATDLREKLFDVNKIIIGSMFALWLFILQFSYLFLPLIKIIFPEYASSEIVIVVYLLTSLFTLLIRISQNNLFKVLSLQKDFIKIEIVVLIIVLATLFFARDSTSLLFVSILILITRALWYLLNEIRLKENVVFAIKLIVGFVIYGVIYLALYHYLDSLWLQFLLFTVVAMPLYYLIGMKFKNQIRNNRG